MYLENVTPEESVRFSDCKIQRAPYHIGDDATRTLSTRAKSQWVLRVIEPHHVLRANHRKRNTTHAGILCAFNVLGNLHNISAVDANSSTVVSRSVVGELHGGLEPGRCRNNMQKYNVTQSDNANDKNNLAPETTGTRLSFLALRSHIGRQNTLQTQSLELETHGGGLSNDPNVQTVRFCTCWVRGSSSRWACNWHEQEIQG